MAQMARVKCTIWCQYLLANDQWLGVNTDLCGVILCHTGPLQTSGLFQSRVSSARQIEFSSMPLTNLFGLKSKGKKVGCY